MKKWLKKYERTKPHVNIRTIGHVNRKTTLTSLLLGFEPQGFADATDYGGIDKARRKRSRHHHSHLPCGVRQRTSTMLMNYLGHADYIKNMITGTARWMEQLW